MSNGQTVTTFDAALKEYYTDDAVEDMVYKNHPFLAMVKKRKDFGGKRLPIPILYANPQGRSANFARAQARSTQTQSLISEWLLTRVKDYGIGVIENEVILASEITDGAFLEAKTTEFDGVIQAITNSLAGKLYRSGFGAIGTVASFSTVTITLGNVEDVVNFEVGMELGLAAAETTGAARAYGSSTNGLIVTGVDRSSGVLTFGFNVNDSTNGISAIANADTIFIRGDRDETSSPVATCISGIEAWIPQAGVTSTTFFGVDRTKDATRLGGIHQDGSAKPIEEALIDASAIAFREGGRIDKCFINPSRYADLIKALGSKVQYVDLKVNARIGFRGVTLSGMGGDFDVVPDPDCPVNRGMCLEMDVWELDGIGDMPRPLNGDGLKMLRQSGNDGYEFRFGYYGNLACRAPGRNVNLKLWFVRGGFGLLFLG